MLRVLLATLIVVALQIAGQEYKCDNLQWIHYHDARNHDNVVSEPPTDDAVWDKYHHHWDYRHHPEFRACRGNYDGRVIEVSR